MDEWKPIIEAVLEEVRPALQMHGGDATLEGIEGKTVRLRLTGACNGCPMSAMTFGVIVDDMIKERLPEVEQVLYEDPPAA